jgi:Bifunctional DNA primase/polymerase, N-terminal/Primase C terminal 1 (PriCT-1)
MTELLEAALRYANRGLPVFPCKPREKVPLVQRGLLAASTDPETIAGWWRMWPDANVAGRTGRASGLVVLDVDGDEGIASLRDLERQHEHLPTTASVVTPSGGQHFYFAHPGGHIPNSASVLGAGLDIRGDGGYAILPQSVGANGRRYEPDERCASAPLPGWLGGRIAAPENGSQARTPTSVWVAIVRDGLPEGQRNDGLARLTGHLLRRLDVALAAELVHLVNGRCRPPLGSGDVDRIIDSIARRELQRRQGAR